MVGIMIKDEWTRVQIVMAYVGFCVCVLFYFINMCTMVYFYSMACTYIELIEVNGPFNKAQAKGFFIFVMAVIAVAFFRFSVYLEICFMIWFPSTRYEYRYTTLYRMPNVVFIYFNLFCPYLTAYLVCKVISFLGANDEEDEEEEVEEVGQVAEVEVVEGMKLSGTRLLDEIDSIRGSIQRDDLETADSPMDSNLAAAVNTRGISESGVDDKRTNGLSASLQLADE